MKILQLKFMQDMMKNSLILLILTDLERYIRFSSEKESILN